VGVVEALPTQTLWLDGATAEVGFERRLEGRLTPGAAALLGGSVLGSPWVDAAAAPQLFVDLGPAGVVLSPAVGWRAGEDPGVLTTGGALRSFAPLGVFSVGATAELRYLAGGYDLLDVDGLIWASTARGPWAVDVVTGAGRVKGAGEERVLGLAPGSGGLRGSAGVTRALRRGIGVRIEAGVERSWGSADYVRGFGLVGVHARRARVESLTPVDAGGTVLEVDAPREARVQVVGSFSGWQPLDLDWDEGRWVLELDLASGSYEYVFLVDGEVQVPAGPSRSDGFGGENGVLSVP